MQTQLRFKESIETAMRDSIKARGPFPARRELDFCDRLEDAFRKAKISFVREYTLTLPTRGTAMHHRRCDFVVFEGGECCVVEVKMSGMKQGLRQLLRYVEAGTITRRLKKYTIVEGAIVTNRPTEFLSYELEKVTISAINPHSLF